MAVNLSHIWITGKRVISDGRGLKKSRKTTMTTMTTKNRGTPHIYKERKETKERKKSLGRD